MDEEQHYAKECYTKSPYSGRNPKFVGVCMCLKVFACDKPTHEQNKQRHELFRTKIVLDCVYAKWLLHKINQ